ncbi:hypothetical protein [Lactiplantibacillus plantarum]|uniref:hypothetical protein n=1 Tax=Lactiplantibacillus plantarum TaxID=1590 RepID=UPI0020BEE33D|nr:hypothetical protein [Lactiplantibacillus plantarum]
MRTYKKKLNGILIIIILLLGIVIHFSSPIISKNNHSTIDVTNMNMLGSNVLGNNNLKGEKANELTEINKNLVKDDFNGAYLGIVGKKLTFSNGFGYSYLGTKNAFRMDSAFFIGQYQNILNTWMLLRVMSMKNIEPTSRLKNFLNVKYMDNSITLEDLLLGNAKYYISNDTLNSITNKNLQSIVENNVVPVRSESKYTDASNLIEMFLIAKLENETYATATNKLLFNKISAINSRVAQNGTIRINDVRSYVRYRKAYKEIQNSSLYDSGLHIKMSIFDLWQSANFIFKSDDTSTNRYQKVLQKVYRRKGILQNNAGKIQFSTSFGGQRIIMNIHEKKTLIVVTNTNRGSIQDLSKRLIQLY